MGTIRLGQGRSGKASCRGLKCELKTRGEDELAMVAEKEANSRGRNRHSTSLEGTLRDRMVAILEPSERWQRAGWVFGECSKCLTSSLEKRSPGLWHLPVAMV